MPTAAGSPDRFPQARALQWPGVEVLELVANVSEGRDRALLDRLLDAATRRGARLLDLHTDIDHDRSVISLAGPVGVMAASAVDLAAACITEIDLEGHSGAHPRLGAFDVCPFVPLDFADPADAREAALDVARDVMQEISELGLPSFAYDLLSQQRTTLPELRRNAFKSLRPAAGPDEPHPTAGAVAVGVRDVLVAFNVDLADAVPADARAVAAEVRESAGGPPGLRAIGLHLPEQGRVQVSMNLTKPRRCGIACAWEAVAAAARARGLRPESCELVGLVPQMAIEGCPAEILEAGAITPARTIEAALVRADLRGPDEGPLRLPVLDRA